MGKLFWGNYQTLKTTLLVITYLIIFITTIIKKDYIHNWGVLTLISFIFGLYICTAAATRDGFHLSVQNVIDGSTSAGLFTISSPTAILGYILAGIIVICCVLSIFLHKGDMRYKLYIIMSFSVISKILIVEISRTIIYLTSNSI